MTESNPDHETGHEEVHDQAQDNQQEQKPEKGFIPDEAVMPLNPEATLAEAGRQILLREFIRMRAQEDGVREDKDIEFVHDMRVATRRQRSAFRLLEAYYKTKPVRPFIQSLKALAGALGAVRDLDVMMLDLRKAQRIYQDQDTSVFDVILSKLDKKRSKAMKKLLALMDSKAHRQFVESYAEFLTQAGVGAKSIDADDIAPSQVRHILPGLLHEHLATVRAYDGVIHEDIDTTDDATLHALRIEFKRLRYATDFFSDVLGDSGRTFIREIKVIQDHLGRMNDIHVAQLQLENYLDLVPDDSDNDDGNDTQEAEAADTSDSAQEAETAVTSPAKDHPLQSYLRELEIEHADLKRRFPDVWRHFNSRGVQEKLSDALLGML